MKKVDTIVRLLSSDIANKKILEVACGCAELSISAARSSHSVWCIDIDDRRIPNSLPHNVHFEVMDAAQMHFSSNEFDTIILYNAFSHIFAQWESVKDECMRILKPSGIIYVISTWNLDVSMMTEVFSHHAVWKDGFFIVSLNSEGHYDDKLPMAGL